MPRPVYREIAEQIRSVWLSRQEDSTPRRLPTQEELAQQFGVSRSTIVRALNSLAAEGAVYSLQGSGVYAVSMTRRMAQERVISLIVPRLHADVVVQATRGVENRARELGYRVLLASSEYDFSHERELIEDHRRLGVAGHILYPITRTLAHRGDDFLERWSPDIPLVALDIGCDTWRCTMVQFDNYRLGYDMTSALLEHGHRHIAFMHMPPERLHNSIHDRRRGWEAALRRQGAAIPDSYRRWPLAHLTPRLPQLERENYEPIARDLLALDPRPDAVITWTDELAALLTRALQRQGVAVPEEIRVCGFDNVERLFEPAFPTSTPDFQRLGALAMDLLARAIEGEDIHRRTYYLPVEVLWREPIPLPRTAEEAIAASRAVD